MALGLDASYQNVGFDYVLDGVRDLLVSEFNYGKIYISPSIKFNDPFQIKLWVSESSTEDYNAHSWSKEYIVDIDLYMIDSNHDENTYKQLHQDTERIYQVLFNNAHKEITVAGNSLQWLNGTVDTIGINEFDGEEEEIEGLLKSTLSFSCNVHAGEISNYSTRSLDFDGSDDYVALSSETNISGDWSFSAWVAPSATSYEGILASKSSSNTMITIQSSTNLRVRLHQPSSSYRTVSWDTGLTAIPTDGSWTHIAITKSGTTLTPYYNGIKGDTGTLNGSDGILKAQMLGGSNADNTFENKFAGNMDEVAIWDTALTQSAITELYNNGKPNDIRLGNFKHLFDSNCKGYWRMGDGTLDEYPLIADQTNATMGSNLVAEDDFSLGAGWSDTGTNSWSYTPTSYTNLLAQNISGVTIGKIYKAEWTIGSNPDGVQLKWVGVNIFNAGAILDTSVGTHTHYGIATTDDFGFRWQGTSGTLTISDIKLQEVQGNAGMMTNMASGDIEEDTP